MLNLFEYSRNFEMTNLAQSGSQSASITEKETLIQELRKLTEEETLIQELRALTALEEKKIYKEPVERLINEFDVTNSIHKTCKAAFSELKATKTLLEKEITLEKLKVYQKANDYLFGSSSFIRSRLMVSSVYLSAIFLPWALSPLLAPLLVGISFGVYVFPLLVAVVLSGVVIAKCLEYLSRDVRLADAVNGIVETVEKQLRPDQLGADAATNIEPVAEKTSGTLMIRSF